ncbi:hypothetical protein [Hymenobacter sp. YC55]|nr:hypothetical protein [Hymenobacter sp. YC55]MDF7814078.1 hypothetical protein [Hymenobacter sp. YC55]
MGRRPFGHPRGHRQVSGLSKPDGFARGYPDGSPGPAAGVAELVVFLV